MNSSIRSAKRLTLKELSPLPITNEAIIDEDYLDFNGHMNVTWYLRLFNRATGGMYRWLGFDWGQLKADGASSFILEGHVRYLAEILVGEHVTLRTRLIARSAKRVQYLHFMFNDDKQKLAATYEQVLAHMDMNTRRMAPYPDPISKRETERRFSQPDVCNWH